MRQPDRARRSPTPPVPVPCRRGDAQHRQVDQPGGAEGDHHVEPLEAQHPAPLGVVPAGHPGLGQRRVQVHHVRHHGGADDAHAQQQAAVAQRRDQAGAGGGRAAPDGKQIVSEAEEDQAEQGGDGQLETPVAALLQHQDAERHHGGDQPGGQQWQPEQQVQPDRRADELGQIGGHRDQFRLGPQARTVARPRRGAPGTAAGRSRLGRHADLRRPGTARSMAIGSASTTDPRPAHAARSSRARGEVGREVARIHVGHRGHERRAEQRGHTAQPQPAGARQGQRERPVPGGGAPEVPGARRLRAPRSRQVQGGVRGHRWC